MGSGPSIKVGVRRGRRSPGHKRAGGFLLIEMPPLRSQPGEGSEQEEEPGATVGLSTAEVTSSEVAITSLAHMFDERQERETAHQEQQYKVLQHQVNQIQPDFEYQGWNYDYGITMTSSFSSQHSKDWRKASSSQRRTGLYALSRC